MMEDQEPTTTLPSGAVVLTCLVDLVRELDASGHTITVSRAVGVEITPAVHDDLAWVLGSNHIDVREILDILAAA